MTSILTTQAKAASKILSLLSPTLHQFGVCSTCAARQCQQQQRTEIIYRNVKSLKIVNRGFTFIANKSKASENAKDKKEENDDDRIYTHHWIGPPDPVSNIRKCEFAKQKNPNKYDIKLEKQQEETFKWNSEFWTQHNQKFFAEKKEFSKKLEASGITDKEASDEMSQFYKDFLDRHYQIHMEYNREWYKRNFGMLLTAFLASLTRIFKR